MIIYLFFKPTLLVTIISGGGDPHFMLRINGVEFPVCFDIIAHEGDVLQMLKDPITGTL